MGIFGKKGKGENIGGGESWVDPEYLAEVEKRQKAVEKSGLEDYELRDTVGTGSFGRVRLACHKKTGYVFALKILSKNLVVKTKQVDHILAEKQILADVQHPFVVQYYSSFQDETYLYLLMEYVVGGEFFTHLRNANRFPNNTARFYAAQVISAFDHLHKNNTIYRDLKPENLLIDKDGNLKITDFGFAKRIDPASKTWTLCGTPEYLAPEIILNKGHGKAVDWWALGILIYEMLVGYPPFFSEDRMQLYQAILAGKIDWPAHISKQARDLISKLLQVDITRRYGNLRGAAKDIKRHPWFKGVDWSALDRREIKAPMRPQAVAEDDTSYFDSYDDDDDPEFSMPISPVDQPQFDEFGPRC